MPRKIRAKTLAGLLSRYLTDFPGEAVEKLEDCDAEDGAELIGLLPRERAWALLKHLPPAAARRWMASCKDETLHGLVRQAAPDLKLDPGAERSVLEQAALANLAARQSEHED